MAQIPSARLANAQSRRCGLMEASWRWGVLLIVLTMAIHAAAVVTMAFAGLSLRARLETRSLNLWNLIAKAAIHPLFSDGSQRSCICARDFSGRMQSDQLTARVHHAGQRGRSPRARSNPDPSIMVSRHPAGAP